MPDPLEFEDEDEDGSDDISPDDLPPVDDGKEKTPVDEEVER